MKLEKMVWSEADFAVMGWLDSQVWAMYADEMKFEFVLDIDYIFKYEDPSPGEKYFSFWVSTATMVFEGVNGVTLKMESKEGAISVANLHLEAGDTGSGLYRFRFECDQGELKIQASGFKFYVRKAPVLMREQYFSYESRGGICFSRSFQGS